MLLFLLLLLFAIIVVSNGCGPQQQSKGAAKTTATAKQHTATRTGETLSGSFEVALECDFEGKKVYGRSISIDF